MRKVITSVSPFFTVGIERSRAITWRSSSQHRWASIERSDLPMAKVIAKTLGDRRSTCRFRMLSFHTWKNAIYAWSMTASYDDIYITSKTVSRNESTSESRRSSYAV